MEAHGAQLCVVAAVAQQTRVQHRGADGRRAAGDAGRIVYRDFDAGVCQVPRHTRAADAGAVYGHPFGRHPPGAHRAPGIGSGQAFTFVRGLVDPPHVETGGLETAPYVACGGKRR